MVNKRTSIIFILVYIFFSGIISGDQDNQSVNFLKKSKDLMKQGRLYCIKGDNYLEKGDSTSALGLYDLALALFEKAENPGWQGTVYRKKGDIYLKNTNYSRADEMYNKALSLFEKAGSPGGQGGVYEHKGDIYFYTGSNLKAFEMYENARMCYEKAQHSKGLGNVYKRKGDIYFFTGHDLKALELYKKALPFFEKVNDIQGQGNVYLCEGDIHSKKNYDSKALEMYTRAMFFFREAEDHAGQGNIYKRKGDIYMKTDDYTRALEHYNESLVFFEKAGITYKQSDVYRSRGDIFFHFGDNERALDMYEISLGISIKLGEIESCAYTLLKIARIWSKQRNKYPALALYEKSILNLEEIRKQTGSSEMKRFFMEKIYDQYEETVVFMLENKYYEKGFGYAESMKARVFLDQMAEGLVEVDKGIDPDLKQKRDELLAKQSIINKEMTQNTGNKDLIRELGRRYHNIDSEFKELLINIHIKNPIYSSVRYPKPISVKDLYGNVLKKEESLIHYFISQDRVYVFLISKENFNTIELEVDEKDIGQIANRYMLSVKCKDIKKMVKYGKKFYQLIFKPLETFLQREKNIIVVPDGQLAAIPFESFVIDNDQSSRPVYLLEKYQIKYTQSASVLATMRKHYKRTSKTKHFIGFGDPVYDYDNYKKGLPEQGNPESGKRDEIKELHRGKYDREGGLLDRLQGSGQEVEAIAGLFKKQNQKCVVHLREQATEENAKSLDLKAFDYIHFSCHGILGDGFQSLVLSQNPKATEDGYLTLNEIMNCYYNAKLVVLSACKTGSGKLERGEGVTGLTRAVMYAGTPAVVASLWNVQDIATKELMVKFYQNMLEKGMKKEEALRQAKLEMIKGGKYSSPFYWSAFVMYGE